MLVRVQGSVFEDAIIIIIIIIRQFVRRHNMSVKSLQGRRMVVRCCPCCASIQMSRELKTVGR